jgi:hypothetical protein
MILIQPTPSILSRKHSSAVTRYPTWEQELYALVEALQEWRCYLEGTKATIYTDHKSLATLMNQRKINGRQSRWIEEIWCYEYQVGWTPGETNLADPFSRRPDHETDININALLDVATHALDDHHEDIKQGYLEDAF